mmetsp:Transcript_38064/g.59363  ORF Transcript_38064/g.59363 Transcript_38064/m.59363 type:complete len:206 (+) Transcript_38064:235-852(+)
MTTILSCEVAALPMKGDALSAMSPESSKGHALAHDMFKHKPVERLGLARALWGPFSLVLQNYLAHWQDPAGGGRNEDFFPGLQVLDVWRLLNHFDPQRMAQIEGKPPHSSEEYATACSVAAHGPRGIASHHKEVGAQALVQESVLVTQDHLMHFLFTSVPKALACRNPSRIFRKRIFSRCPHDLNIDRLGWPCAQRLHMNQKLML